MLKHKTISGFEIYSKLDLSDDLTQSLISGINKIEDAHKFGARSSVSELRLDSSAKVIIKNYRRGGFFTFLNTDWHLRLGKSRALRELEYLYKVKELGISVPDAIASIEHGNFFYRCYLVAELIEQHQTIAELAVNEENRARELLILAMQQVLKLINAKVFHIDLHPGNILLDAQGKIYLIDFDKCRMFKGTREQLRNLYLCRWRRSVIKHKLPHFLAEIASAELMVKFKD